MTYFKVLAEGGRPHHGGRGSWPLPSGSRPGKWLKVDGKVVPCRNGLHLCRTDDLIHWLGPVIYEAETRGEPIVSENKIVVAEARLLRRCENWNERTARLFAIDCAKRALNRERRAGREPDKRSWDALKVARRFAEGNASQKELAAARDAAWDAAWAAARDAAWAAARDAARAAAWAAARDAARAAATKWQTKRLLEYVEGKRG